MAHQSITLRNIRLNLVYFTGQLDSADLAHAIDGADSDAAFDDLIVCAADASFAGVDFSPLKELFRDEAQSSGTRRALVTANAMQGVLGRMFLGFMRGVAPEGFEIECFDTLATALAWISAGRTFGPKIDRSVVLRTLADLERRLGNFDPGTASAG